MQFPVTFPFLVIPTGAGSTSARITINVGGDGSIKVYGAGGVLIAVIQPLSSATAVFGAATGPQVRIGNTAGSGFIQFPTHGAKENSVSQIVSSTVNGGAANEYQVLTLFGPSDIDATDRVFFSMASQNDDGTSDANFQWSINEGGSDSTLMTLDKTLGFRVRRSGVTRFQVLPSGKTDITNSVTNVSGLSVNNPTGQTAHLADFNVNSVIKAFIDFDGSFEGAAGVFSSSVTAQNLDSGIASVTTIANQWVQVSVNFNQTFNGVPRVVAMGHNAAPAVGGSTVLECTATSVTTTGFTLGVLRGTAVTMDISWFAHFV
jgi:hypothetical protein